mmetsp:Transcript_5126/g.14693  ORF Transcript_5126/g.14693 Transcript_5126/m.14693 type:complete len:262 (-) Transcript_5126:2360-3145(-)
MNIVRGLHLRCQGVLVDSLRVGLDEADRVALDRAEGIVQRLHGVVLTSLPICKPFDLLHRLVFVLLLACRPGLRVDVVLCDIILARLPILGAVLGGLAVLVLALLIVFRDGRRCWSLLGEFLHFGRRLFVGCNGCAGVVLVFGGSHGVLPCRVLRGSRPRAITGDRRLVRSVVPSAIQDVRVESSRLDGQEVKVPLLVALAENVLLDGVLADQAVYVDFACLSDPVAPILRLCIHGRVPIGIVEDHRVGPRQIHPHASAPR